MRSISMPSLSHYVAADLIVFEGLPHALWAYLQTPESDETFTIKANFFKTRLSTSADD